MAKTYATCRIDGMIELTNCYPGDGYFALCVGDRQAILRAVQATAEVDAGRTGDAIARVPATRADAAPRENLDAIARYINTLANTDGHGFRALEA